MRIGAWSSRTCGVAVFVVGVTLVKGYESEQRREDAPGDTVELGGYIFRLDEVERRARPELHRGARRRSTVTRDGKPVTELHPEKRLYTVAEQCR